MGAGVATRIAHLSPRIWQLSWRAVHQLPFLLPHDKSYLALRHFIDVEPDGLFLDVGANDGISVLSFRKLSRGYRILSLEPNPMLEPALRALSAADPRLTYKMVAAGAAHGRARFYIPVYRGIALHPLTAAQADQARNAMASTFGEKVATEAEMREVECEIVRIDDLSVDPAIIKIDAEGAELDVLRGSSATLARSRPFLMIEIVWEAKDEIAAFLHQRGYRLLAYEGARKQFMHHGGAAGTLWDNRNLFGVPEEKLPEIPVKEVFAVFAAAMGH